MTELLNLAMAAAETLSEKDQDTLARVVLDEARRLAIQEGIDDIDAGRIASDGDVQAWLRSWGTDNELPAPKCL